jgi:hypothetical protein
MFHFWVGTSVGEGVYMGDEEASLVDEVAVEVGLIVGGTAGEGDKVGAGTDELGVTGGVSERLNIMDDANISDAAIMLIVNRAIMGLAYCRGNLKLGTLGCGHQSSQRLRCRFTVLVSCNF